MLLLYRLLRGKKYRQQRAVRFDPANPPKRMRWRPKLSTLGLVSGLLGGVGAVVLFAQYGLEPVTSRALSARGAIGAGAAGIGVPSAVFSFVVWRFNKKLAAFTASGAGTAARATSLAIVAAPVVVVAAILFTPPHPASVVGPCSAEFGGVDAAGRTTSVGDAVEVEQDGILTYAMAAPEDLRSWEFWLQYGPVTVPIASGTERPSDPDGEDLGLGLNQGTDGNFLIDFESVLGAPVVDGNIVAGAVRVDEFAWMGVGLYEVHGSVVTVSGTSCTGVVLADVQGDPLSSIVGAAAAGAVAVGAAGAAAVALAGLRDGGEQLAALHAWAAAGGPGGPDAGAPGPNASGRRSDEEEPGLA